MKEHLDTIRAAVGRAGRWVAVRWRGLGLSAGTLLLCGFLVVAGIAARRQAAADRTEIGQLRRTVSLMERWQQSFEPAATDEAQVWRASERRLRNLTIGEEDRIGLARVVAERLELAGLGDAVMAFVETTGDVPPYEVAGEWTLEPGPFALSVELMADLPQVLDLLQVLPAQVRVQRLTMTRTAGGIQVQLLLSTFRVVGVDEAAG